MIIGILSDTHGNHALMLRVAEYAARTLKAELFIHLGDDYGDGQALAWRGYEVRQVPGLWCEEYHDSRVPKRLTEQFEGLTLVAVHAAKDLRAVDRAADIILTGHTHKPCIELVGNTLHMNPGHAARNLDRGEEATFGLLEITPERLYAAVYLVSGKKRCDKTINRRPAD